MPRILCIETSTMVCSVCLAEDGVVTALEESNEGRAHASLLTIYIDRILKKKCLPDMVAVSMGPGSYTGLRIGVSVAKGLVYGAGIPLAGIPTLQAFAHAALSHPLVKETGKKALLVPMIDARRMEVYVSVFDTGNRVVQETRALVVEPGSFEILLNRGKVFFFGSGADKCRQVIVHPNALFIENFHASSTHLVPLAQRAFQERNFADTAYFEPFYLKDFVPTVPRKNLFQPPEKHV